LAALARCAGDANAHPMVRPDFAACRIHPSVWFCFSVFGMPNTEKSLERVSTAEVFRLMDP
jgi:hypothetical protein